jgi:hypothetical protein
MCKKCRENKEREEKKRAFRMRIESLKVDLYHLLIVDRIKGSEYARVLDMLASPDEENISVAETVIQELAKQEELA